MLDLLPTPCFGCIVRNLQILVFTAAGSQKARSGFKQQVREDKEMQDKRQSSRSLKFELLYITWESSSLPYINILPKHQVPVAVEFSDSITVSDPSPTLQNMSTVFPNSDLTCSCWRRLKRLRCQPPWLGPRNSCSWSQFTVSSTHCHCQHDLPSFLSCSLSYDDGIYSEGSAERTTEWRELRSQQLLPKGELHNHSHRYGYRTTARRE